MSKLSTMTSNPIGPCVLAFDANVANMWTLPGYAGVSSASMVLTANRLFFTPVYMALSGNFTGIGISVSSPAAAGKVARLGIYHGTIDSDGQVKPGALLLDAGTVAIDSAGTKSIVTSFTLGRGYWFIATSADDSPVLFVGAKSQAAHCSGVQSSLSSLFSGGYVTPTVDVTNGADPLPDPAPTPTGGGSRMVAALRL